MASRHIPLATCLNETPVKLVFIMAMSPQGKNPLQKNFVGVFFIIPMRVFKLQSDLIAFAVGMSQVSRVFR